MKCAGPGRAVSTMPLAGVQVTASGQSASAASGSAVTRARRPSDRACVASAWALAGLREAITTIYPAQQRNLESEDYIEGPRAFAEKRPPRWAVE